MTDSTNKVVGVLSGYDILINDNTPGRLDRSAGMFPPIGSCAQYVGGP